MRAYDFGTLRYLVKSSDLEHRYLCDLVSHGGLGQCDCAHARYRHTPLAKVGDPLANEAMCKHLREARAKLARFLIRHLAGKGLLTYSGQGVVTDLEANSCTCGEGDCSHLATAREDLVSRYVKSVLREHGNEFDH